MLTIQRFASGPFDTNAYLVGCSETKEAILIDPAPESASLVKHAIQEGHWLPKKIVLTHSHWDHIADVSKVLEDFPELDVCVHPLDAPNLEKPGADGLPCWIPVNGVHPTILLEEGDSLSCGQSQFTIIHTPGHTPGGICLYEPQEHLLISGDTLFKGTIGNLSFPTSAPEKMWDSLDKLSKLPPATKVYPGHGPSTTLREENWLPKARQIFGVGL